jgi:hypothetical protein
VDSLSGKAHEKWSGSSSPAKIIRKSVKALRFIPVKFDFETSVSD